MPVHQNVMNLDKYIQDMQSKIDFLEHELDTYKNYLNGIQNPKSIEIIDMSFATKLAFFPSFLIEITPNTGPQFTIYCGENLTISKKISDTSIEKSIY